MITSTASVSREESLLAEKPDAILPPLPYSLHPRKRSIALQWTLLLLFTSLLVEFLYFLLRYAPPHSPSTALTVPTALLGAFSALAIGYRAWLLYRPGSQRRPIGGKYWAGDFFQVNMILGFGLVTGVLASATGQDPPDVRQASMPQAVVLFLAGSQLVVTGVMAGRGWRTPVRLSSTGYGTIARPGVFVLMEDIVAVDGGGGQEYRRGLVARYEASAVFRRLLMHLNWFWGVGSLIVAGAVTIIVFVVEDLNVVFALGWSLPWAWALGGICYTFWWSRLMLRYERQTWDSVGR